MIDTLGRQLERGLGSRCNMYERYSELAAERSPYLERAREYSRLSIPYLVPQSADRAGYAANQQGYSSVGAISVNHLSNKVVTTLFPPQASFFKQEFLPEVSRELAEQGYSEVALKEVLVDIEKSARQKQDAVAIRPVLTEHAKQMIVAGSCVLFMDPQGRYCDAIPLDRFVVRLGSDGEINELAIETCKDFSSMPDDIKQALALYSPGKSYRPEDKIKFYRYIKRHMGGAYGVYQICENIQIREPQEVSDADKLPWIYVPWNRHYEENYGRGLIEDNAGDFYVADFLAEALVRGMVLMSDIKYLIRPGSQVDPDRFAQSQSGEVLSGIEGDITVIQLQKYADYTPIAAVLEKYEKRIGQAFLSNLAIRREAERVTTYELRLDAQELEVSLGGVYSRLSQTLQLPIAKRLLRLVKVPDSVLSKVQPIIITGIEALGRVGDMEKIMQFSELMQLPNTWPVPIQERTKWGVYTSDVAASLSMKLPWIMSDEELAQQQEAQANAAQEQNLGMEAAKAAPKVIEQQIGGQNA